MRRTDDGLHKLMLLLVAVLTGSACAVPANAVAAQRPGQRGGVVATPPAASNLSDRQACAVEKTVLTPSNTTFDFRRVAEIRFVKDGIVVDLGKNKVTTLPYKEMSQVEVKLGKRNYNDVGLQMRDKKRHRFGFDDTLTDAKGSLEALESAMNTLMAHAQQGAPALCSDDPADYDAELAGFERETAAWRALPAKPALSDGVYKDRLLAEDALKSRDMTASLGFYESGIASDPTWAQGWYNAALIYAETGDNFDAALCMKHYVVLVPEAPDVRTAKDNIILWESKAAKTASAVAAAPPAPSRRGK